MRRLRSGPTALGARPIALGALLIAFVAHSAPVAAQVVVPLTTIGSETAERGRLAQLVGQAPIDSVLLRAPSRTTAHLPGRRLAVIAPEVRVLSNSALPNSENDGSLRGGRGVSTLQLTGVDLVAGRVHVVLAPQFVAEENRGFQAIPYPERRIPSRSPWANPFHPPPESIDLPLRFGTEATAWVDAGQSSVTVNAGALSLGVANENIWWGPGIRNAIILSNNAPGFPHAFLRPSSALRTGIGELDFDVIAGRLHDSPFFNETTTTRSLGGLALTWRPNFDPQLQLGFSRLRISGTTGHDQMSSLFGRWVFPAAGLEAYGEWARFEDPTSLRDFLESPNHSQGYTMGLQWAHRAVLGGTLRLQTELSYLEPDATLRVRPVRTSYTSTDVPQGFTERGQLLGAAIGPGSSSQSVAMDVFGAPWRWGLFAGRVRRDNGVLFEPIVPEVKRADVTLLAGMRASTVWRRVRALVEYSYQTRLNYLFQSYLDDPATGRTGGIDIGNRTLSVTFSTAIRQ